MASRQHVSRRRAPEPVEPAPAAALRRPERPAGSADSGAAAGAGEGLRAEPAASQAPRRRVGGRSARVVLEVLDATLDELARVGYRALTYEAVAARAGVSRTTLYRRWPAKLDLVRAAFARLREERPQPPDTGTVRGDIVELLGKRLAGLSPRDRGLIRALLTEFADPEVASLARTVAGRHQEGLAAILARGIERGELPANTDPRLLLEPIAGAVFLRMSMLGEGPTPESVGRVVDLVLAGVAAGGAIGEVPRPRVRRSRPAAPRSRPAGP